MVPNPNTTSFHRLNQSTARAHPGWFLNQLQDRHYTHSDLPNASHHISPILIHFMEWASWRQMLASLTSQHWCHFPPPSPSWRRKRKSLNKNIWQHRPCLAPSRFPLDPSSTIHKSVWVQFHSHPLRSGCRVCSPHNRQEGKKETPPLLHSETHMA